MKYLKGNLTIYPLSKLTVVGSPIMIYTFPSHGLWYGLQYQVWMPSCIASLKFKSNLQAFDDLHKSHATNSFVGTSCLSGQYYSMQSPPLGRSTDVFSSQGFCIVPSAFMEEASRTVSFFYGTNLLCLHQQTLSY